jgi:hypothetical protein
MLLCRCCEELQETTLTILICCSDCIGAMACSPSPWPMPPYLLWSLSPDRSSDRAFSSWHFLAPPSHFRTERLWRAHRVYTVSIFGVACLLRALCGCPDCLARRVLDISWSSRRRHGVVTAPSQLKSAQSTAAVNGSRVCNCSNIEVPNRSQLLLELFLVAMSTHMFWLDFRVSTRCRKNN